MNKQQPKQYLLFVYGDFRKKDKIVELISLQLSSFTTINSNIKFNYGDYGAIYNFESENSFFEIRDHVHIILEKVSFQYFLIEQPKNIYAYMPPELKINLFDLFSDNDNEENNIVNEKPDISLMDMFFMNMNTTFSDDNTFNESNTTFSLSEEDKERILRNIFDRLEEDTDYKKPTIDDLLDKIQENGIKSLSEQEMKLLDEYSKKH